MEGTLYKTAVLVGLGCCVLGLWLVYRRNVVKVRLGGQQITIIKGTAEESINWLYVQRISPLMAFDFPVYVLKIQDRPGYYLFTTQPYFANSAFGDWWDMSAMGTYIKRKKKELEI